MLVLERGNSFLEPSEALDPELRSIFTFPRHTTLPLNIHRGFLPLDV